MMYYNFWNSCECICVVCTKVDVRVLNEWECIVNELVGKRIASLKRKHINRRRGHILKNERHLRSLEKLHIVSMFWYQQIRQPIMRLWCVRSTIYKW